MVVSHGAFEIRRFFELSGHPGIDKPITPASVRAPAWRPGVESGAARSGATVWPTSWRIESRARARAKPLPPGAGLMLKAAHHDGSGAHT